MMPGYRVASPLGDIVLRAEDDYLTGLFFAGQKYFPVLTIVAGVQTLPPLVSKAQDELAEYFSGVRTVFSVPIRLRGTPFQRLVWNELRAIPFGAAMSYGALATRLGLAAGSARAVGSAVGRNPVSIIVPCHRVVGSTGDLTGYAGGVERKKALLSLEGSHAQSALFPATSV